MADSQAQLGIGSVVTGTVQSLKPYGAFIDIGGINGLLHVSQISHDRVSDIGTVLQPGDTLKVMILSHDRERGRVSPSTKKLEPTRGDMICNPELVFEKSKIEIATDEPQRVKKWVLSNICQNWKNYKSKLKKTYYDPFHTTWDVGH
ncbi:hypothetical protein MRB53_010514 [Persea americana]|uniref:Uncharacterized protein n=1 Tax=Persea americana TaxID=3435 RepID=A0ACC2LS70_PERAE|nr:hypothetical protein MRB53_010514 [Persea americana]